MASGVLRCVVLLCAVACVSATQSGTNCAAEVKTAIASCMANVAKAKGGVGKACARNDDGALKEKVGGLKKLAGAQKQALKESESLLAAARSKAGAIAKQSASVRKSLLQGLAKQKAGKKKLGDAKKTATKEDKGLTTLRQQADAAMQQAVNLASATGDAGRVSAAKDKAHSLYRKMVDEKIRIASVHRQVVEAQKNLAKISAAVEKQIEQAKATANAEAQALKSVARIREEVSKHSLEASKYEMQQASNLDKSAKTKEKATVRKLSDAQSHMMSGQQMVKSAQKVESQAKSAESAVARTRVSVGPLDLAKLRKQAEKIVVSGGKLPEVHGSIHDTYAAQVRSIESQRMAAKKIYDKANSKLEQLKSSGGAPAAINNAKAAVDAAASRLRGLVQKQHAAVTKAVKAVEKEPK